LYNQFYSQRFFLFLFLIFTQIKNELWAVQIAVVGVELHGVVRIMARVVLVVVINLMFLIGWQISLYLVDNQAMI
jgi:hypothetical protein